jgi:diguanylate cyclase (GGDEF)-like protein/PAS domain S-box-containing protein
MIPGSDSLLIVDDDAMNCDVMVRYFSMYGFEISAQSNGKDALEWIHSHRVDLVLLDIEMPGLNGLDVLKTLRENYTQAQLPIIMVTGRTSSDDIVVALDAGANDYLTKPIDYPVMLARVKTQLSRKHAEEALHESEERYALAVRGANDGLWDWDLLTDTAYFSPRWKLMLGWDERDIGDSPDEWFRRIHPDDIQRVRSDIAAHIAGQTPHYEDEYRMLHKDGVYLWMLGRGLIVRDPSGKPYRMAGSQTDITRGKVVDVLTGLPNRVLFMDRLSRSFERAKRRSDKTIALLFLDLDSFKLVNDSLGHLVGDHLLVAIAERLEAIVRPTDSVGRFASSHTVARLGGDEFTILLEDVSNVVDATRVAERIAGDLAKPFVAGGQEVFPTVSIGIALFNPSYQTPEELLCDADTAMYSAKALGKGRYQIFDVAMRANAAARLQLEAELRRAIERREFENYYQPIISMETGEIIGFETIVRWNHPARGFILPDEFMPVAVETGLSVPLEQWSMETACRQMRAWQDDFAADPPLQISLNLSGRNLRQPDLLQRISALLRETNLSGGSLCFEISENSMMPDPQRTTDLLHQLKAYGIRLTLDDFGKGYSSLEHLHRFPLDCLKIDHSFVSRLGTESEIVSTIFLLGQNLGLTVMADGIETKEQISRLRDFGCKFVQGNYFSAPISVEEATGLLTEKRGWAGLLDTLRRERSSSASGCLSHFEPSAFRKSKPKIHKECQGI